jgi:hypothetical protein
MLAWELVRNSDKNIQHKNVYKIVFKNKNVHEILITVLWLLLKTANSLKSYDKFIIFLFIMRYLCHTIIFRSLRTYMITDGAALQYYSDSGSNKL